MFDETTRAAVEPLVRLFDRLGIDYYIGGSLASIAYGEPRSTLDADFVAALDESHAEVIPTELGDAFYASPAQIRDAILRRSSFNLISFSTSFKLDVFLPQDRPFSRSELERRIRLKIGDDPELFAWFASAEDILLNKLEWYRKGGEVSDRQWRDILGVLRVSSSALDLSYLARWARELELTDLLERARGDAGHEV